MSQIDKSPKLHPVTGKQITILMHFWGPDHHPIFRAIGYRVLHTEEVGFFMKLARDEHYDVVLTWQWMYDWHFVLRLVHAFRPEMPVIVYQNARITLREALDMGYADILPVPFKYDTFPGVIERVLLNQADRKQN